MAVVYEDECVGCHRELGCLGNSCPNRNVPHLICDKCEEDVETLYENENGQLCEGCVLEMFEKVRVD